MALLTGIEDYSLLDAVSGHSDGRRHHQIPAHKRERSSVAGLHVRVLSYDRRERKAQGDFASNKLLAFASRGQRRIKE
jgi:hypothetical protein